MAEDKNAVKKLARTLGRLVRVQKVVKEEAKKE